MLTLLSHIYRLIWTTRKRFYEKGVLKTKRLPCPVICVGNLTTGGTGKTPAVITLTRLINGFYGDLYRIAILTRGYKRRSTDPILVVSDRKKIIAKPYESGDEPYLLASALKGTPVIAGRDRHRTGRYAIDNFNANLFILDDGYQHLGLHRDIDILLIDATNPLGNGYLLPGGTLREPPSGISRASCIIISRADEGNREYAEGLIRSCNKDSPIFNAIYKPVNIADMKGNTLGFDYIAGKDILLFSGIGNPESFRKTVENIGGKVKGEIIFPDHYWYKEKDMQRVIGEADRLAVKAIMTTEKDSVRFIDNPLMAEIHCNIDILILRIEMEIDNRFQEWILKQALRQGSACIERSEK